MKNDEHEKFKIPPKLMDPSGFEPEAFRVQGGRSTGLIYGPNMTGPLLIKSSRGR